MRGRDDTGTLLMREMRRGGSGTSTGCGEDERTSAAHHTVK